VDLTVTARGQANIGTPSVVHHAIRIGFEREEKSSLASRL
jgi:hypothetical protein